MAEREVRSVGYQMKVARFPGYRDLGVWAAEGKSLMSFESLER
jgi:hypothetical protein